MKSFFIASLLLFSFLLFSQKQRPIWSDYSVTNNLQSEENQLQFDSLGNLYVLNANSKIKKYDPISGSLITEFTVMGDTILEGLEMVVDFLGNIVVSGHQNLSSTGVDLVVAKYNSSGVRQWFKTYNGSLNREDRAEGLALDANGNIYVTGTINDNSSPISNSDVITLKYNAAGVLQWSNIFNGLTNRKDRARDIEVNYLGEVFIVGSTLDYIGHNPLSSFPSDYSFKSFFIKYDATGTLVWNKKSTTHQMGIYSGPGGISGNVYRNDDVSYQLIIEGNYVYVVSDIFVGITNTTWDWIGLYDSYYEPRVTKYSFSGTNLGYKQFSIGSCNNSSRSIKEKIQTLKVDDLGHLYIIRRCGSSKKLEKYNASRSLIYSKTYSNNHEELAVTLKNNNLYMLKTSIVLVATTPSLYVYQFDSLGGQRSRLSNYGGGVWYAGDIAVDDKNDIYVSVEQNRLHKYCGSFPDVQTRSDTSICYGDSIELRSVSDADSYKWTNPMSLSDSSLLSPIAFPGKSINYIITASYISGCKSYDTVKVQVKSKEKEIYLCNGDSADFNGKTYYTQGIYLDTITVSGSCDSIVIITVNTGKDSSYTDSANICLGDSLLFGNRYLKTAGTYRDTLSSASGCDSISILNLTISPTYFLSDTLTICQGDSISIFNTYRKISGVYYDNNQTGVGCDSIHKTTLIVLPSLSRQENRSACNSYVWPQTGMLYSNSGNYYDTLINAMGCDSIIMLNLVLYQESRDSINITACNSYFWVNTGATYTTSGFYHDTLMNMNGCDSITTLALSLNTAKTTVISQSACNSFFWSQTGATYQTSDLYADTLTTAFGCDSVVALDLVINYSQEQVDTITSCDSYTWSHNGVTYNSSGIFMDTLINQNGCDSIVGLNLTINNSVMDTMVVHSCGNYTWARNGNVYAASGTYLEVQPTSQGCDSISVLQLSIGYPSSSFSQLTACSSYVWSQTGINYTASGVYSDTISNSSGCDSVISLNLTIDSVDLTISQNSYTLIANQMGSTYQWMNCSNGYIKIPGATNRSFTATSNGDYAVEIGLNSCTDTSSCTSILNVGLEKVENKSRLAVFPNPANNYFYISVPGDVKKQEHFVSVFNIEGKLLMQIRIGNSKTKVLTSHFSKGIYFIKAGSHTQKLVIQ